MKGDNIKTEKFLIGFVIIAILLSVNMVSAEDNLTSTDFQNFSSIQNLIDNANAGDTITLENATYEGSGEAITINKNITITGLSNTTLDAKSSSGIFIVKENINVNLKGLSLINSYVADDTGAILNKGQLQIENIKMQNCIGRSVYSAPSSKLTITDSTFENSSYSYGAALYIEDCECVIINSTIKNSSASSDGGAIYIKYGSLDIYNSLFTNNYATRGGGIYNNKGTVKVYSSTFISNKVSGFGGAIKNWGICEVYDCKIINNTAGEYGGGLYTFYYKMTVENSLIENNTAYYGGGAFCDAGSKLWIYDSTFNHNSASNGGGIHLNKGGLIVKNSEITNNSAENDGGGVYLNIGDANIIYSSFTNNIANTAYAVYINNATYSINDNWWGLNYPNFNELLNVIPKNFNWTIITSKLTFSGTTFVYGSGKSLTVTLKDNHGNPICNADITVKINNKKYVKTTDSKGRIKLAIKLTPSKYTTKVIYSGDSQHVGDSKTFKITINKVKSKINIVKTSFKVKKSKKIKITLKDKFNHVIPNAKLTMKIKGKTYKIKTNSKGIALKKIKLSKKGKYKLTVKFKGNKCYNALKKVIKISVKK